MTLRPVTKCHMTGSVVIRLHGANDAVIMTGAARGKTHGVVPVQARDGCAWPHPAMGAKPAGEEGAGTSGALRSRPWFKCRCGPTRLFSRSKTV